VTHFVDLKWLLLIPVLPTMGIMAWSVLKVTRGRNGGLLRWAGFRRRNRVEVWDWYAAGDADRRAMVPAGGNFTSSNGLSEFIGNRLLPPIPPSLSPKASS